MRILADENIPLPVVERLKQAHDVVWARTDCPGLRDRELLERAEAEGRVILTLDKDFRQIALQRPTPLKGSGVILLRVFPAIAGNLTPVIDSILSAEHMWIGHVSTATKEGIEMIPTGRGSRD